MTGYISFESGMSANAAASARRAGQGRRTLQHAIGRVEPLDDLEALLTGKKLQRGNRGVRSVRDAGSKDECLAYVEENWTDMRPKSLRDAMDG